MSQKSIALIPARGGSKRIPKKNIKLFHGKPIIAYSIEAAIQSGVFDTIIVSTDDEEIAKIAKEYGAKVPFMRPKELSDDYATKKDIIDHALAFLKQEDREYDYLCTIYATAPFLQSEYLQKGLRVLKDSDAIYAFSAASMPFPIQRTFKIDDNQRAQMFWPENYYTRSQDLEEAYQDAGQFYWQTLKATSNEVLFGKDSIPIILPRYLVQDIDTLEDWKRAELMYQTLKS
jgi:pseudaminic acid cytidylyltransferase